jgi:hypothetical protein
MKLDFEIRSPRGYKSKRSLEEHYTLVISGVTWFERTFKKFVPNGTYRIYGLRHGEYSMFLTEKNREHYIKGDVPEYIKQAIIEYKAVTEIDVEAMHEKQIW